jgi:hypothetical protein
MAYIEVISQYLPGGAEENHENINKNSRCLDRDPKSNTSSVIATPTCSIAAL